MARDENSGVLFINAAKVNDDEVYASGKLFVGTEQHELEAWKYRDVNKGDVLELRCSHKKSSRAAGDGSGEMLRVEKKNDKQPDWKGGIKMESGELFDLAGWRRQSDKGIWFLSLKLTPKQARQEEATGTTGF